VNKPFKGFIRNEFDGWMTTNSGVRAKPTRQVVSHWVQRAYDSVLKSTLINSWRHALDLSVNTEEFGLTKDDGDEDNHGCDDFLILSPFFVGECVDE
jgi:hypothetical protein